MRKQWNKEDTDNFIKLYPRTPQDELALIFGRTISAMETKAHNLGIKKEINMVGKEIFLEEEINKILELCNTMSVPEISRLLGRDKASVYSLLERLEMKNPASSFWWTEDEVNFLIENYENNTKEFLEENLNKKWKTISKKARLLNLKRKTKNGKIYVAPVPLSEEQKIFIYEHCHNLTLSQISKEIGKSVQGIKSFYRENNIEEFRTRKILSDYSNEHLLSKLVELSEYLGRCPIISEVQKARDIPSIDTYYDRFGTFANACELAGLVPCYGFYGKVCYAKNGDRCFSSREQIITNFFIDNNLIYEKEKLYSDIIPSLKDKTRMDWYLPDFYVVVEFFGLDNETYNNKTKRKIKICNQNKIKIIPLFEKDVENLKNIFDIYIK